MICQASTVKKILSRQPSRMRFPSLTRPASIATLVFSLALPVLARDPGVVINEIMYHPPGDAENLQYIELFNAGSTQVDLGNWSFNRGIKFTFPARTTLAPGKFLVVCRDTRAFASHYGQSAPVVGNFTGKLSHHGDRVELTDAKQAVVDSVKYSDQAPWPSAPDGYSPSLERISPFASADAPENWASSRLPSRKFAAGTPGKENESYSTNVPPAITNVVFSPSSPAPLEKVTVSVNVASPVEIEKVALLYRLATSGRELPEKEVPMSRQSGDSKAGLYRGVIDGQPPGQLVRFRIKVTDRNGTERLQPSINEPRPAFSYATIVNTNTSAVPFIHLINVGRMQPPGPYASRNMMGQRDETPGPTRGAGALIYLAPGKKETEVFDYVLVKSRKAGRKVHLLRDHLLLGMSEINILFEQSPRQVLSEPLSYQVYRMAGVPAEYADHVRLWVDGHLYGYQELIEQPNRTFVARHRPDASGDLYKALWMGQSVVERHEKKTNPATGYDDLVKLINGLNARSGQQQWEFIRQNFDVEEFASYFAVNMCIQNWDGFFNNYFVYHEPGGKWQIYPWDEDKTWGDFDGTSSRYDWYEMPLTFGMNGDSAPSSLFGRFGGGPFGGVSWWRPPGMLSGPMLANPFFRKEFLNRLRTICMTVFAEEKILPLIALMEKRLEPEVQIRAQITGQNPHAALQLFHQDIQSFRNQVRERRKFILAQLSRGG